MWCYFRNCNCIPNVTLIGFRLHCGTLNSNQSNECECVMEFIGNRFKVLKQGPLGYDWGLPFSKHGLGVLNTFNT